MRFRILTLLVLAVATNCFRPSQTAAATRLASLPVKEVTIFKDGHAFVLHEGEAEVGPDGRVQIDDLPKPVLGTFWPFSTDKNARLTAVTAARRRVELEHTALSIRELLEANVGARIIVHETLDRSYQATIVDVPVRSSRELRELATGDADLQPLEKGGIILLKTDYGIKVESIDKLHNVTFVDAPKQTAAFEEFRNLLTLQFDWQENVPSQSAHIGMTYLQKGLRWIPQYRVTLMKDGNARVELQGTLLNELTDLQGVTAHLVIGVPTFAFQDTLDPLALDQTLDQLSAYFRKNPEAASQFTNGMLLNYQVARMGDYRDRGSEPQGAAIAPEIGGGDSDLFVFSLNDLDLARGERMVVTLGSWTVSYSDLYRLTLPIAPPRELRQYFESQRQQQISELLHAPKVKHIARLKNTSAVPFTTAPALLIKDGRPLAQGMMTYTSAGSSVDLEITDAVNVPITYEDDETRRVPNAQAFAGNSYDRVELSGKICLTNYHGQPIRIEVERLLLGGADGATPDAEITRPGLQGQLGWDLPPWWSGYSWPNWWHHLNSISRIRWSEEIGPGESLELGYKWHYFWR